MTLVRLSSLALVLALVPLGAACSDNMPADDDGTYNCDVDTRDEPFLAGMKKTGDGGIEFTLMSSTPAPPARGDNAWVLGLASNAAPVDGATITVVPYMPDHRHGTSIIPVITPGATAGTYDISPVNLWMPGLWEITVNATPAGGTQDSVVFRFCIPG